MEMEDGDAEQKLYPSDTQAIRIERYCVDISVEEYVKGSDNKFEHTQYTLFSKEVDHLRYNSKISWETGN